MSAGAAVCQEQVARLSVLINFPTFAQGVRELVKTLGDVALTDPHAIAVVDEYLAGSEYSPTPVGLRHIALELAPRFGGGAAARPKDCDQCAGGWRRVLRLVTRTKDGKTWELITEEQAAALYPRLKDSQSQMIYSAVQFCECPAGDRQREFERRRKAMPETEPKKGKGR